MIPILYDKAETDFTSNGITRLVDCLSCTVTEERNGVYELEFTYPITGRNYDLIQEGQIIAATHDDNGEIQPFDIYHRTAPLDGIVTFYAHHISYRLNGIAVKPYTTTTDIAAALAGLKTNSVGTNPFTFWTEKTTEGEYSVTLPSSLKALLGGQENSLLDVFGAGEYEFDTFDVKLWARRGVDTDVEIRYGKNLTDIEHDVDFSDAYNGIVPYWFGQVDSGGEMVDTLITLPEWVIYASGTTYDGRNTTIPMDLTDQFQEPPTVADLRAVAQTRISSDTLKANESTKVSFVQLWQTEEYKDVAPLQAVNLCDTVNVIYPELGVDKTRVKVIKTVYNTLLDRYDEMELGDAVASYASIVTAGNSSKIAKLEDGLQIVSTAAQQALDDAATAAQAATAAEASASTAAGAASRAESAAQVANDAAAEAKVEAQNAQTSADAAAAQAAEAQTQSGIANAYANAALDQLGVVEDIVGVLDLLQKNGTYALTADTEVQNGKWYFTRSGTAPNYIYSVVNNPSGDPSAEGWYELTGIDEAIQNYVSSQLAVDDAGLWLKTAGMQTKVLLSATDGVVLYGTDGTVVGKYGATAQIGDAAGFHIEIDGTKLGFYQGTREVAYISNNQLYITQSVVLQQMDLGIKVSDGGLGQWSWKVHANGQTPKRNNLNLKWIG